MKTLLIASLLSSVGLVLSFNGGHEILPDGHLSGSMSKSVYGCPPCGCDHDETNFAEPGKCPNCQMKLIPREGGVKGEIAESMSGLFMNNPTLGMNFYDFINEYRIEEVKEQLLNPKNNILTKVAVAYDSGFNSKSTFNALFKKYVKMTPKDYKKQSATSPVEQDHC